MEGTGEMKQFIVEENTQTEYRVYEVDDGGKQVRGIFKTKTEANFYADILSGKLEGKGEEVPF